MNIKSLVSNIIECIDYYEKRCFEDVEADCRNLERKYDNNDNTAQGFLVAIRKQEHCVKVNTKLIKKFKIKLIKKFNINLVTKMVLFTILVYFWFMKTPCFTRGSKSF